MHAAKIKKSESAVEMGSATSSVVTVMVDVISSVKQTVSPSSIRCNPIFIDGAFLNTGLAVVGTAAAFGRKKRNVQNLSELNLGVVSTVLHSAARIVRSAERFASVDADKNGAVTLQEAIDYLNLHNVARRDVKGATPSWLIEKCKHITF